MTVKFRVLQVPQSPQNVARHLGKASPQWERRGAVSSCFLSFQNSRQSPERAQKAACAWKRWVLRQKNNGTQESHLQMFLVPRFISIGEGEAGSTAGLVRTSQERFVHWKGFCTTLGIHSGHDAELRMGRGCFLSFCRQQWGFSLFSFHPEETRGGSAGCRFGRGIHSQSNLLDSACC